MVKYTANGCPSEDDEESVLADYCDTVGWKHTHFSNETYTTSWNQKHKMKKLGVHSGIPDHLVLVPLKNTGEIVPVYIEMKRVKGGTVSDAQFEWILALRNAGQIVTVCFGGEDAVDFLTAVHVGDAEKIAKNTEKFEKKLKNWQKKQEKKKNECPF